MTFHSEYGEDKWIAENIKLPAQGFYLDIGCAHPINGSNTAFLRQMGWKGLAIDANPIYQRFWTHAPFVSGVVSRHPWVQFKFNADPGWSRVAEVASSTMLCTTTIERLLGDNRLDFLSLDVEGHEYDALLSMNMAKHRPQVIISEYATAQENAPPREDFRVKEYLESKGYSEVHRTMANIIFLNESMH